MSELNDYWHWVVLPDVLNCQIECWTHTRLAQLQNWFSIVNDVTKLQLWMLQSQVSLLSQSCDWQVVTDTALVLTMGLTSAHTV